MPFSEIITIFENFVTREVSTDSKLLVKIEVNLETN